MTTQQKVPKWLQRGLSVSLIALALAAAPTAHAGFENGGFEANATNMSPWTAKNYERASGALVTFPPTQFSHLALSTGTGINLATGDSVQAYKSNLPFIRSGISNSLVDDTRCGNGGASGNCIGENSAPNLTLPRWGENTLRVGGHGGRVASSVEQTATMTVADIDPIDGKIHVRFAMAPIMFDQGHPGPRQPYFFVEVYNETKGTQLFNTFNFSNQSGIPWQENGGYKYTDWQGFDISPGNGLLDVDDKVTMRVYVANCADGGAGHTSVVYLDAVGAFMPGLAVNAVGPTNTKPDEKITYTYNYVNNSGVYALGTKIHVAAPVVMGKQSTEDAAGPAPKETTFVGVPVGPDGEACLGPQAGQGTAPYKRGDYYICNAGDLSNGQGGSFDVTFKVPSDADYPGVDNVPTVAPYNVINNGDYNIFGEAVSPYVGPLVKTTILASGAELVDLGVTIGNGGKSSYVVGGVETYTVTVTNHGGTAIDGTVTQTLTGMGSNCGALTLTGGAICAPTAAGVEITYSTGSLIPNDTTSYTVTGPVDGTPNVNTIAKVAPTAPSNIDSNMPNNTAGMNTPTGNSQGDLTVNTDGNGVGHVLSTEPTFKCGNASTACTSTGVTNGVVDGQEIRFTPVANTGSIFTGWKDCEAPVGLVEGNLCIVNGTEAKGKKVTANFIDAVVVTPKVDPANNKGSISPGATQVEKGTTTPPVFTITPELNYYPKIVTGTDTTCVGTMTGPVLGEYAYTPASPVDESCQFTVQFKLPEPHVSVLVTPPTGLNIPGDKVYGKVTCTSDGDIAAPNAQCEVPQPPGVTKWDTVSCTPAATVDPLAVGDAIVCEYGYIVPDIAPGQPGNPVEITGVSSCSTGLDCGDTDVKEKSPNVPALPGNPGEPHVSIVVTPPSTPLIPGNTVSGKVICTSDGAVTAKNAFCNVLPPAGIPPADWSYSCTPSQAVGSLPVGSTIECDYVYKVPGEPVRIDGNSGCTTGAACSDEDGKVLVPRQPNTPHITTRVTPPSTPLIPGNTVTGKVTCTSDGEVDAPNAFCHVPQPPSVDEWNLVCTPAASVNPLTMGSLITCDYSYKVPEQPVKVTGNGGCLAANCGSDDAKILVPRGAIPAPVGVPVDNPFALLLLALGMLGLGARYARKRNAV